MKVSAAELKIPVFRSSLKASAGVLADPSSRVNVPSSCKSSTHALLAEFLILIEDVIKGFSESGKEVVKLLHQKDTSFALVTTAQNSSLRSTKMLAQELQAKNFSLGAVFINRCFPEELLKHIETALNQSSDDTRYSHHDLEILAKKGYSIEANVKSLGPILHAHGFGDVPVGKVSERKENIHTLESLARFADDL